MTDRITIEGTAGTTPQLRTIPSGRQVVNLRVASTLRKQDPTTGQWSDAGTNWYTVSAWGDLAAHVADSIRQGDPVLVTGRQRIATWGDGERQGTAVEIDAETIGHSLRWGTSTFQRAARRSAEPTTSHVPPSDADPSGVDANGWASPGAVATDATSVASQPQPVLAGAGIDDEPPF